MAFFLMDVLCVLLTIIRSVVDKRFKYLKRRSIV